MRINSVVEKIADRGQDWLLGIETGGILPTIDRPGAVYYATIGYPLIRNILHRLDLHPSDVFVDIGSGKGRVSCMAARYNLRRVVGVECSAELALIARRNAARLRGKQTVIEICNQPAEEYDYSSATVLYLFNPFEAQILDVVLGKIRSDSSGRSIKLAFIMESRDQEAVFRAHSWLHCYSRWTDHVGHACALYGNT